MTHSDGAQGQVTCRQSLSHRDQVGDNFPVIDGEPLAGSSESGHDLVGNNQDAVLVAYFAHALHVAIGRNENAIRAGDGFEDEGGDRLRSFELDDLFDHVERFLSRVGFAVNAVVRIEYADNARNARLGCPSAGIARQADRSGGRAVIRTITRNDLVATGVKTRDLDGVLIGLGPAIGEEESVDVARSDFSELRTEAGTRLSCHERIGIAQRLRLLVNSLDDALVTVSDVDRHQLAVEVDETLPIGRPKINALGAGNRDRVNLRLRRRLENRVILSEIDNFLARHRGGFSSSRHDSKSSPPQSHRDTEKTNSFGKDTS